LGLNPDVQILVVMVWEQLTGKTDDAQIDIPTEKPYALSINMGGDDVSVVAIVYWKL
jgi:acetyl-CoA C-acetyltransferase/acetyl-CoA acyltransferase